MTIASERTAETQIRIDRFMTDAADIGARSGRLRLPGRKQQCIRMNGWKAKRKRRVGRSQVAGRRSQVAGRRRRTETQNAERRTQNAER